MLYFYVCFVQVIVDLKNCRTDHNDTVFRFLKGGFDHCLPSVTFHSIQTVKTFFCLFFVRVGYFCSFTGLLVSPHGSQRIVLYILSVRILIIELYGVIDLLRIPYSIHSVIRGLLVCENAGRSLCLSAIICILVDCILIIISKEQICSRQVFICIYCLLNICLGIYLCLSFPRPSKELVTCTLRSSRYQDILIDREIVIRPDKTINTINIVVVPMDVCRSSVLSRSILSTELDCICRFFDLCMCLILGIAYISRIFRIYPL